MSFRLRYLFFVSSLIFFSNVAISNSIDSLQVEIITSEFIFQNAGFKDSHASTIAETDEGLVAAWFGGPHEKHPEVSIYLSRKFDCIWSKPEMVADGVINDTLRYPCWNPVLYKIPNGDLMLFYKVGPTPEEWWGMLKTSNDNGRTWSKAKELPKGILGPIKNKPVLINDSIFISPTSTENKVTKDWRVHFEISKDFGETWIRVGPIGNNKYKIIQPSILNYGNGKLQILARSNHDYVFTSWSNDNGYTWSNPEPTTLPNPNSGTDALTLKNGLQLIVYNHIKKEEGKNGGPRTPLNIAISENGKDWRMIYTLENIAPAEFSYPAVIQTKDEDIHITYTYLNRSTIKHVRLRLNQIN